jgi:hypothetical protein
MGQLAWAALCYKALVDRQSQQISVIDIIDELNIRLEPGQEPPSGEELSSFGMRAEFVALWRRSDPEIPEALKIYMEIFTPSGMSVFRHDSEIDLINWPRNRFIGRLQHFPLLGEGTYRFVTSSWDTDREEWAPGHEVPIVVRIVPPEE